MATAEEGGATTATSSYGGEGGAGGKFRRKPFRRPTTPYDRPTIAPAATARNGNFFSKLVDLPSRFISYSARRFFESVIRKRLPPPSPPQISDSSHVLRDGPPEAVPSEPAGGECSQPIRNSARNAISDLELLLKQKTFTRSEIDYLTELLHSRGEVSLRDDGKRNKETISDFGSRQQIESGAVEADRSKLDRHYGVVSTPISNSKVLGDSIASPAELAKTYMGSRPSELSPSVPSDHGLVTWENTKLLSNMRIASKPVSLSLTTKSVVGSGLPENGYITKPSSLRRSAIYNMSRSPYSKRTGINHSGYAGLPLPSTSLSIMGNSESSESKGMALKRRSFVLDDQVGSFGQIRRVRQKSNLIAPGVTYSDRVGSNSDAVLVSSKQKLPLIDDPMHAASTSYAIVPYEYNNAEVVVRQPGNMEKTTLKDKSESKVAAVGHKSPFKLSSSMLRGQALKSMEDAAYSELAMNVQDDHKFESSAGLLGAHDFPPQEQGKNEENGPVETSDPSETYYPAINNDSAVSLGVSLVRDGTPEYVESCLSQPQNKAAFRMSALEDCVDLDDDLPCSGVASHPFSGGRGSPKAHIAESKFSPPEEPGVLESAIQSELKSPSDLMLSKTNEVSSSVAVTASLGKGSNGIITPASEDVTAAALPTIPLSVASFDKPKEINNPSSLFSFSSKVEDKFPPLMPESSCRIPEISSSLLDVSAPTSSLLKVVDPEKGGYPKPLAAEDTSRNFDTVSVAASNGPLVSGVPAVSFTATSHNTNTHQISTAAPVIFTPSVGVSDCIPSGSGSISSTTSNGIIFGATDAPKLSGEPAFKFGLSPDPSAIVSGVSTTGEPAFKFGVSSDPSAKVSAVSTTREPAFKFGVAADPSAKVSAVPTTGEPAFKFGVAPDPSAKVSAVPTTGKPAFKFGVAPDPSAKVSAVPTTGEPAFKFGVPPDPSAKVSEVSTTTVPEEVLKNKALTDSCPGIANSSSTKFIAFGTPSSGNMTPGLNSSANIPSANNLQGSLFSSDSKSFSLNVGTVSQGASAQSFSLASQPSSKTNSNTSFVSSLSSSQVFSPTMSFGLNSSASSSDTGAVVSSSGPVSSLFGVNPSTVSNGSAGGSSSSATPSVFSFGLSSSSSSINAIGSTAGTSASGFSFGASPSGSAPATTSFFSSSSSSTSAVGLTGGAAPSVFSFGLSSPASTSVSNGVSSFSNGASSVFKFGGSSSASFSAINSNIASSNAFDSSLQAPTSIFSSSPSTGFSFGVSATSSTPMNSAPVFNSSSSPFSFASSAFSSSPSPTVAQSVFGNAAPVFGASSPVNYQMSGEDSMAEDPVQSSAPTVPVFGQADISPPSTSGFVFGSSVPSQPNPFQFGGQPNQGVPQNPSMFQASNSVDFNGGGSFSLGSVGDKTGRKIVKASRNKNRKK